MTSHPPPARHRLSFSWLWLAYPLFIFAGLQLLAPRYLAILLGLGLLLRWRQRLPHLLASFSRIQKLLAGLLILWMISTAISNDEALLRSYPAVISLALLLIFGLSLKYPPSAIEIFARMQQPALPSSAIDYTRRVTVAWCLFFLLNGSVALYTAFHASRAWWLLYNGIIAYALMGMLFAGEWLVRRHVMARKP